MRRIGLFALCLVAAACLRGTRAGDAAANERVYQTLREPASWNFQDLPLSEFAERLSREIGHPVLVDAAALDDAGVGNPQVSGEFADIPRGAALAEALEPLELVLGIESGTLWITTPDAVQGRLMMRSYALPDAEASWIAEEGIELVESLIAPDTWDNVGGRGATAFMNDHAFMVWQTPLVHLAIDDLLERLSHPGGESEGQAQLEQQLDEPAEISVPLEDLAELIVWLRDQKITVRVDEHAFGASGIGLDETVAVQPRGATIRDVLDQAARPHDLAWLTRNAALVLTTTDEAAVQVDVRVYDVSNVALDDAHLARVVSLVWPDSWDEVGGRGSRKITTYLDRRLLAVAQTQAAHRQVEDLLARLPKGENPAAPASAPARHGRKYLHAPSWNKPRVFKADG